MGGRRSFHNRHTNRPSRRPAETVAEVRRIPVKTPPKQYGKPFILLEDERKNTFEFQGGAWVPFAHSIAECRVDCQVTQLSQKVNKMTRYEIRPLLPAEGA